MRFVNNKYLLFCALSLMLLGCESGNSNGDSRGIEGTASSSGVTDRGKDNDNSGEEEGCDSDEKEFDIEYLWSLEDEAVTLTNHSECNSVFIWATATPPCDICNNIVHPVFKNLSPGESFVAQAGIPEYLTWKPEVVYSFGTDLGYVYHPKQAGTATDIHRTVLLLDYSDVHIGQLDQFKDMYLVDEHEDIRGSCQNFEWVERENGVYQINESSDLKESYCFIGNIKGFTESGDDSYLPELWYFVTDKDRFIE